MAWSAGHELIEYNNCLKEFNDSYRNVAKRFGLPECAFWILYMLRVEGPLTQREICDLQYQPKQTVNSALKKMLAAGLIRLEAGADQRSKRAALTQAGTRLAMSTVDRVAGAEIEALAGLPDRERVQLFALLKKYNSLLRAQLERLTGGPDTPG